MVRFFLPLALIVATAVATVGEYVYRFSQLPAMMINHFDAQGLPNGWAPKETVATTLGITYLFTVLLCAATVASIRYLPVGVINVPNRDYWLAPDRERETRLMLVSRMLWFWAATFLFMAWVSHGILQANLAQVPALSIFPVLAMYLGFTAVWTAELLWRFGRSPAGRASSIG